MNVDCYMHQSKGAKILVTQLLKHYSLDQHFGWFIDTASLMITCDWMQGKQNCWNHHEKDLLWKKVSRRLILAVTTLFAKASTFS